jgi:hypothetical protein
VDWTKWLADLAVAGICGFFGASLGSYLKGYWTKKGENLATYEDIKSLLAQERGKAYEQEKGKRLATHEDIENVLKQVQAVTRETETIKAQIGSDLWLRQTIWNQKREAYANILKCSYSAQDALNLWRSTLQVLRDCRQQNVPEQEILRLEALLGTRLQEYVVVHGKFLNALSEAQMFVDAASIRLLNEYRSGITNVVSEANDPKIEQVMILMMKWTERLVAAGKQDLGVDASEAAELADTLT